jgi:predicted transcriptional regulator
MKTAILAIVDTQQSHSSHSQKLPMITALSYLFKRETEYTFSCNFTKDGFNLRSEELEEYVEELSDEGYLQIEESVTYGRDIRKTVYITEQGKDFLNNSANRTTVKKEARIIAEEHGDIPISNFVNSIRESENPIDWT